jgi:hypothetical protein
MRRFITYYEAKAKTRSYLMATVNQLVRKPRARKVAKSNVPALKPARRNVAYVLVYILPLLKTELRTAKFAVFV